MPSTDFNLEIKNPFQYNAILEAIFRLSARIEQKTKLASPYVAASIKGAAFVDKWTGLPSLVSMINGFGPALVALTILQGFPKQFPDLMPYFLFAGCLTAFIGLINGMIERIQSQLYKLARDDYQAITDASYLYIFTLQTVIAIYLSADTHFNPNAGGKNDPIFSSNLFFTVLASLCAIPALLSVAFNIVNNHYSIKNKALIATNKILEFIVTASLAHDLCDAATNSKDNMTYSSETLGYIVALLVAGGLQIANQKIPQIASKGMDYLSAMNFTLFIANYIAYLEQDKDDVNHTMRNTFLALIAAFVLVNTSFAVRVATREMSPLKKTSMFNVDGLADTLEKQLKRLKKQGELVDLPKMDDEELELAAEQMPLVAINKEDNNNNKPRGYGAIN